MAADSILNKTSAPGMEIIDKISRIKLESVSSYDGTAVAFPVHGGPRRARGQETGDGKAHPIYD